MSVSQGGEHKSAAQIISIALELLAVPELVLVTRVTAAKAEAVLAAVPPGSLTYHPQAACLSTALPPPDPRLGPVLVLGAGSSDLSVASEASLQRRPAGGS